jgi:glucose uptake protein
MGLFYGFVASSMAKDFANPEAGALTPYTAVVFFAVGIFSAFYFQYHSDEFPFEGAPVSFADYLEAMPEVT